MRAAIVLLLSAALFATSLTPGTLAGKGETLLERARDWTLHLASETMGATGDASEGAADEAEATSAPKAEAKATEGSSSDTANDESKGGAKDESKVESKVESKDESNVEAKDESNVEAKDGTKDETRDDGKDDAADDASENAGSDAKDEAKGESKVEDKDESKVEDKVEAQNESKDESKVEPKAEAGGDDKGGSASDASEQDASKPKDNLVTTSHTATIGGEKIAYTATAGTMVVDVDGEKAEMFFVAYTKDGVDDVSERPITFAFNGGPGAASGYINFGCFGPRKVELDESGKPVSLPAKIKDNENSLLDLSDLVFIDPVGTGYSRPCDKDSLKSFIGYENDIASMAEFIRLYVNRNDRWGSEKYIAGESYGTARAVGLCDYLGSTYSLNVNGIILISAVNDLSKILETDGNDMSYVLFLPTLAADAWYHERLSKTYQDMLLEDFLDEVREFAQKDYLCGLFMGNRASKEERDKLAERVAGYIGLTKDFVVRHDLRVSLEDFRTELLRDTDLSIGRYDGRFSGPLMEDVAGDTDPSSTDLDTAFGNAFMDYVTRELKFKTDVPYVPLSYDVYDDWNGVAYPGDNGYIAQEKTIEAMMARNKFLKVWVLCGYFDGATPFFGSEWVFSHVTLNDENKGNLQFTYYPSGHMIYVDEASHAQLKKDAKAWLAK